MFLQNNKVQYLGRDYPINLDILGRIGKHLVQSESIEIGEKGLKTSGTGRALGSDPSPGERPAGRNEVLMRRTAWVYHWLGIGALAAAAGCQPSTPANTDVLKIGAYSVVREVLHDGVLPAFQAEWKSRTGRDLEFQESYNGSGARRERSRAGSTRTWRSSPTRATWASSSKPAG